MNPKKLREEVEQLAKEGLELLRASVERQANGDLTGLAHTDYERWYAKARRVVEQVLPERMPEFTQLYRPERPPSKLDLSTYTVSHYLAGIGLPRHDAAEAAAARAFSQVAILQSAAAVLEAKIADLTGVVRAELFDDELDVADELMKKGHLRAAGAVSGVVLERHLKVLITSHEVPLRKKKPTLGDLNDALKEAGVYDVPTWRRLQLLTDYRNLAVHEKGKEPTPEDIRELIEGTRRTIKTLF